MGTSTCMDLLTFCLDNAQKIKRKLAMVQLLLMKFCTFMKEELMQIGTSMHSTYCQINSAIVAAMMLSGHIRLRGLASNYYDLINTVCRGTIIQIGGMQAIGCHIFPL